MEIKIFNKKTILLAAIIAIAILGIVIYFLYNRTANKLITSLAVTTGQDNTVPQEPPVPLEEKDTSIKKVLNERIENPVVEKNGSYIIFQSFDDGCFYKTNLDGSGITKISDPLYFAEYIAWSDDLRKIVFSVKQDSYFMGQVKSPFQDDSLIDGERSLWFYNFDTKAFERLNRNITDAEISPDGSQILYYYRDSESNTASLSVKNSGSSSWSELKKITDPNLDILKIGFLDENNIYYLPRKTTIGDNEDSISVTNQELYSINIATKQDQALTKTNGLDDIKYFKDNGAFIYSTYGSSGIDRALGIFSLSDKKTSDLSINTDTGLDNFILSKNEDFILYFENTETTTQIYKYTIASQKSEMIREIPSNNVENIQLLNDKTLYFTIDFDLYETGL